MGRETQVTLAAIANAHGIAGEVRLKLFAQGLGTLKAQKQVDVGGRMLTIVSIRETPGGPILRFAEIGDRNAAEALRSQLITIARAALPPLAPGEYYHADLIGLPCKSAEGEGLGTVFAIENFGAGDILEIERPDGKRVMVPFRDGIAELGDGEILVDPAFVA